MATDEIAKKLKHKDTEALCVALGAGDLTSASIATALQHLRGSDPQSLKSRPAVKRPESKPNSVGVAGIGDLLCNFARCCRPVPPERIVGYITQGRGISIHRQDCGNFLGLKARSPERVLATNWGESGKGSYTVDLTLLAFDRSGLIRDITSVLADEDANVLALNTHTDKKSLEVMMSLSLEIGTCRH